VYGAFAEPSDFGSGGGSARGASATVASGGGAVKIQAQRLRVDGTISADASTNRTYMQGGGSGGSIYIIADVVEGNGTIRANGADTGLSGDDSSGAGGGGRVAVYYGDMSGFSGRMQAKGGVARYVRRSEQQAGAGTVYLKKASESLGQLVIDNGDNSTPGWSTLLFSDELLRLNSWTIPATPVFRQRTGCESPMEIPPRSPASSAVGISEWRSDRFQHLGLWQHHGPGNQPSH